MTRSKVVEKTSTGKRKIARGRALVSAEIKIVLVGERLKRRRVKSGGQEGGPAKKKKEERQG